MPHRLPRSSGAPHAPRPGGDCRCECGSLLARVVDAGIELKCKRCKRVLLVPVTLGPDGPPRHAALRVIETE